MANVRPSSPARDLTATREGSFITVVSGLPRSGTSLMMQMLQAGGHPLLTDRGPDESNPRGFLEFEPVTRLRMDRSWLMEANGHAVKIIHLLLRELPVDGSLQYRVILMQRPLPEGLASQRAMLLRAGKPSADDALLTKVFLSPLNEAVDFVKAERCFRVLAWEYHSLLADPASQADRVSALLDVQLDVDAMVAAVDPALHRQRQSKD